MCHLSLNIKHFVTSDLKKILKFYYLKLFPKIQSSANLRVLFCVFSLTCEPQTSFHIQFQNIGMTPTDKIGPEKCPRVELLRSIKPDPEDRRKIYVPSGTAKKVTVFGYNLYDFMQDIRCFFSFGQGHDVRARVVEGHIECDEVPVSVLNLNLCTSMNYGY